MADIQKETLVKWLMEKDELVLKTAIAYAESYLKYGVDVTEKFDTAVKQTYSLYRAKEEGYYEGINKMQRELVRCKDCVRRGTYQCPVYVGGDGMCSEPDEWYCADAEREKDNGKTENRL